MTGILLTAAALALTATSTWAALFTDPALLHKTGEAYDYIVVGSGPGGSTVAARLSEDPHVNVLIIEAGPTGKDALQLEVPALVPDIQSGSPFDWNYTIVPQPGLNSRTLPYSRGKVLGGCSAINWMFWVRCAQDDYDKIAEITGDEGWSWTSMLRFWQKVERLVPPVDGRDATGELDPVIHGTRGAVNITVPNVRFPTDKPVIDAAKEVGGDFRLIEDYNDGNPLGLGWLQGANGHGIRNDAATAYLNPALSRLNLDILVETQVTKLIQTGISKGKPTFLGVEFAQSSTSPRYVLNAAREVIVSGGAINTPQLLMLSGIGPSAHLTSLGIDTVVDLPDVGQHLVDHPVITFAYNVTESRDDVFTNLNRNQTYADEALREWQTSRSGIMTNAGNSQLAFFRLPANDSIFETVPDPSSGPTAPHLEFIPLVRIVFASPVPGLFPFLGIPPTGYYTLSAVVVETPTARGNITLSSSDPFTYPIINPNLLGTPFDIAAARYGIRATARFMSAHAWDGFLAGPTPALGLAGVDLSSDAEVGAYAREHALTLWHPTSTARMGACAGKDGSVVGPDLRVKGVEGLRVVDASIFPFVPAGHPQAMIYTFAERAAELIQSGHRAC
ncbi:alcohol oxidase [Cubamyces lactineus]|nr:alcohol oxidase [Cubamyces lactineus]